MNIGIVGAGSDKFSPEGKEAAYSLIRALLSVPDAILISGHSPVGGIDIWAEEVARELGVPMELKVPKQKCWDAEYGYKQRNLDIAICSNAVHVIVVDDYPNTYHGRKFSMCYHCKKLGHIKSGGCWTGLMAKAYGRLVEWHIIKNKK